ncbi:MULTISPECIES: hypothetical protein [Pseudomonas]|uniref:hypothetical protein n=1 Tax=Pseudomonas TaxID=286 RepID=UPI001260163E|nr:MULTISPECIES: hypothetical protein [Pseudomonas]
MLDHIQNPVQVFINAILSSHCGNIARPGGFMNPSGGYYVLATACPEASRRMLRYEEDLHESRKKAHRCKRPGKICARASKKREEPPANTGYWRVIAGV